MSKELVSEGNDFIVSFKSRKFNSPAAIEAFKVSGVDGTVSINGQPIFLGDFPAPGFMFRTGSGVPSNSLGVDGDVYLDTATGIEYVHSAGAYVVLANPMVPGSTYRTGAGVPSNGLGVDGDVYLDSATGIFYVRTAGTYSAVNTPAAPGAGKFSMFYGLTTGTGNGGPNDYAATVAVKTSAGTGRVPFPRVGPTNGAATAASVSSFTLPNVGTYKVTFNVQTTEVGQLQLELNGAAVNESTAGNQNPTSGGHELNSTTIITTVAINAVLAVINPAGNSTALTIVPADGSETHANAQRIIIEQIA